MKRIIAMIKPNMLDDVIFALHRIEEFPGATMTDDVTRSRSSPHVPAAGASNANRSR